MALYEKGNYSSAIKAFDEAIEAYNEAIRIDQAYAEAWHNKGNAHKALDHSIEAEEAFTKAKELGYTG